MLPSIIKDGEVFVEGKGYFGKVEEITPPVLATKTEDFQAGGMIAALGVDMGLEKLESSFKCYEWSEDIYKKFGSINGSAVGFRYMFSSEREDASEELKSIEIVMRGRIVKADPGSYKKGSISMLGVDIEPTYVRYDVDGKTLVEVDVPNMIYIVDGVDRLAKRRAAIGRS
jgi:P2 family phage contractile tail tube protein